MVPSHAHACRRAFGPALSGQSIYSLQVDIREAYDAAKDPDLADTVGWVPSLHGEVDPAHKLQALTSSGTGPFNW